MNEHDEQTAMSSPETGASPGPAGKAAPGDGPRSFVLGRSPSQILWLKLRRNRTAMIGLYILGAMYAAAILAGFIAPYKYDNARNDLPFHPPMLTRIHIFDEDGRFSRPFVYELVPVDPQVASDREDPS